MNAVRVFLVLVVLALCLFVAGTGYFANKAGQLEGDLRPKNVTVVDAGVFLPMAAVKSVFGADTPVHVHASPSGSDTAGAKSVDSNGTIHVWVPTQFVGGTASLTPAEAQEYVLRQLAGCQDECVINYEQSVLDAETLKQMASDESVERLGVSEMMDTFMLAETFRFALEQQAEVAKHGMDTIAIVARSGDVAQTATAVAGSLSGAVVGIAAVVGALLILYLLVKKKDN